MSSFRIIFVTLAIFGVTISKTLATDYVVGGKSGWKLNINYQAWADSQDFYVGDRLIFKYAVGNHNVVKVDKDSFQACMVPTAAQILKTGEDVIELMTPGTKYYICGVGYHCDVGPMKLSINVWEREYENSPAPAPTSGGSYY